MLIRYFIVVLLLFSVTYADVGNNDDKVEGEAVHEGSPLDVKISAIISRLKTDIYRKLDDVEKKRSNKLNEIENKLNNLEKTSHDLEENIYQKLQKLEKSILDKLKEYINGKIDSSGKHMYRKMDELQKYLPEKTDINILNHNLNFVQKMPNANNLTVSNICDSKTLQNIKLESNEEINQKLIVIDKNISKLVNTTAHLDALNQQFTNIEENLNHKYTEINKKLFEIKHNMNQTLTEHDMDITKDMEMNMYPKFDNVEKKLLAINKNLIWEFAILENTCIQNINDKLDNLETIIPELQQDIIRRINALEEIRNVSKEINNTRKDQCMKLVVGRYNYRSVLHIRMDKETFKYATVESGAAGLIHFEMLLAIQAAKDVVIVLSPGKSLEKTEKFLAIDIGEENNTVTSIRHKSLTSLSERISTINTPNILSPSKLTAFIFKINDGTLEFSKVGSPVILKYKDELLRKVKYIGFSSWFKMNATILYDCPPNLNFEGN